MDNSWRASLPYDARQKLTKRFLETLVHHMPVAGQDSVDEVLKIACHNEEDAFRGATDQQDYLRKLSLRMLIFETKANRNPLQARDTPGAQAATTASQPQQVQQELEQQWQQVLPQLKQHWQQEQQRQQRQRPVQQHFSQLKLAKECMEAVEKMPSWNFNNEQCDYLVDKLNVVIQSASCHLDALCAEDHQPYSSVELARHAENFKLLLALANQVKSFVQDCCKDAWIQAAMALTNVAEYVSFMGFNLELCKVAFCKERVGSETLTLAEVVNITNVEVEIVKEKASTDSQTLLAKLRSLRSLRGGKRDSVNYILERLSRFQGNQDSSTSRSSSSAGKDEESFWKRLFECVKPAERLGRGSAATVHKAKWLGIQVAKKTFEGHRNMDFMKEVGILGLPSFLINYFHYKNHLLQLISN